MQYPSAKRAKVAWACSDVQPRSLIMDLLPEAMRAPVDAVTPVNATPARPEEISGTRLENGDQMN